MVIKLIVCIIAGLGAGFGTGFAGMSAAAVISPMLITFLGVPAYEAVGIALASDVLASAVSANNYRKNKNIDIKNGVVMMIFVLIFTLIGSYIAKLVPNGTMGGMSVLMTTKEKRLESSRKKQIIQSVVSGALVGFICGFIGAGGGMMMLLVLTSFLGYELKTAVGTSVFIMTFTALTGALSHFVIGGIPDIQCLVLCIISTLVFAQIASKLANKASPKTLNRAVGVILVILGISMMIIKLVK